MLVAQTLFSRAELDAGGAVSIRVTKQVVDKDTGVVVSSEYHRTSVNPIVPINQAEVARDGVSPVFVTIQDQIEQVNGHLAEMGFPALDEAMVARIELVHKLVAAPAGKMADAAEAMAKALSD